MYGHELGWVRIAASDSDDIRLCDRDGNQIVVRNLIRIVISVLPFHWSIDARHGIFLSDVIDSNVEVHCDRIGEVLGLLYLTRI